MNVKYDIKKVPRELLEEYAMQQLCMNPARRDPIDATSEVGKRVVKAAEIPLKTKAEIDAVIVKIVRQYSEECGWDHGSTSKGLLGVGPEILAGSLYKLLQQETSD